MDSINLWENVSSVTNYAASTESTGVIDEDLAESLASVTDVMGAIVIPLTGCVGIVFNCLTMAVVMYMGMDTSSLVYMLLVAIGDSTSVFIDTILNIGFTHWGWVVVLTRSDLSCKVGQWVSYLTTFATQYTLALFTLDRLLAIAKPIMYKQSLKDKLWYPVAATGVTYVVVSGLLCGNLWMFTLENGACLTDSSLSPTLQTFYFHYSVTFLYCGLPAVVLFVLNFAIIYKLKTAPSAGRGSNKSRENSITRGLLVVSFSYLVITLLGSLNLYIVLTVTQPKISDNDPKWEKLTVLMFYVGEWCGAINQSVNFFLYILGSQSFRKEFLKLIRVARATPAESKTEDTKVNAN
ncbi:uncharacterized protein LOC142345285 [Convolutriloba macropyga]|uniref:uncharacterized protein LOC142345285 n=1 Tax=Convolutriloba macropyga TaxID=536237 RepID=UPI003F51F43E